MEPLIELPVEKWPTMQEKLKTLWPLNVAGFYSIYLNLKYPGVQKAFKFKVYCPFGDMENGFVAINVKPGCSQDVILFPVTQDTFKLEQAVISTKLIDWSQKVCVDCLSSVTLKTMNMVKKELQFSVYEVGIAKTFFLDKTTKVFGDKSCPLNTHIASVKEEHLQRINDVWPYKFDGSLQYFSTFALNGLSYGLYYKNKLVTWLFLNEYYFLCHLYCEEEHRRKGYAEVLMRYVVNEQLKIGNDLYAYVVDGNERPRRLFEKLGFVDVDRSGWIFAKK